MGIKPLWHSSGLILWLGCKTTGFTHSRLYQLYFSTAVLRFSRVAFASKGYVSILKVLENLSGLGKHGK